MKTFTNLLVASACAALFACGTSNTPEAPVVTKSTTVDPSIAINSKKEAWMVAVAKGDGAAIAALYTEDATVMAPDGKLISGRENIGNFFGGMKETGMISVNIQSDDIEPCGDGAIEVGTYETIGAGDKIINKGRYMNQWEQREGAWLIHRLIYNSDLPDQKTTAQTDQQVAVVAYKVKRGRNTDFEDFMRNRLLPAIDTTKQEYATAIKQTRFLVPSEPAQDGTYTYLFIMDPVVEGVDYSIENALKAKHGEALAIQHLKELKSMLAEPYVLYTTKESDLYGKDEL